MDFDSGWLVLPLGVVLAYMGSSYLGKAQDLGSFNPNSIEQIPVTPVPVGTEGHPYKMMPMTRVNKKIPTRRVTHAAPPNFK